MTGIMPERAGSECWSNHLTSPDTRILFTLLLEKCHFHAL